MHDFFIQNPLLSILLCLFLFEQIVIYFFSSYPYRYGLVVKKISLPYAKQIIEIHPQIFYLKTKINKSETEMYLCYRYRFGTCGPILFVGQVTIDNGGTTYIRIGFFSAILLFYLVLRSILLTKDAFFSVLNVGCMLGAIIFFYLRLIRNYEKLTK